MDDASLHRPSLPNGSATVVDPAGETPSDPSSFGVNKGPNSTIAKRRIKNKGKAPMSDSASSASSSNCYGAVSSSQQGFKVSRNPKGIRVGSVSGRKSAGPSEADILGLHVGMSIAAFVSQVLERKRDAGDSMSAENLSKICILAVRESVANVSGNKFDSFVTNFEKSFHSTLKTLRLISESALNVSEQHQTVRESSCSVASTPFSLDRVDDSAGPSGALSFPESSTLLRSHSREKIEDSTEIDSMNRQLIMHEGPIKQQLSTIEKSVREQTRSNDLKTLEIGLTMKKLQLKERELALHTDLNFLERLKLSIGYSKASFKVEKFKTQLQDARQVELLRKCLDFLVAGLIIMLLSLAYGTYIFSRRRIIEASESCSPASESKSWWMPKSMSNFNTILQLIKCQVQVLSRMLFGTIMIASMTILLIQRSSTSQQTMPITFILLLLGVACGYTGKFCVNTLGASGNHWLIYWEAFCLLHFFSNIFHSTLFLILNGPIKVAGRVEHNAIFPYWVRRLLFYATLIILPLLGGLMPFASPRQWINHFSSQASDFMDVLED